MNFIIQLLTLVLAFGTTAIIGKWAIPFLHKLKFGQTIREVGPAWHQKKQGTPTMGGIMFIFGILITVAIVLPLNVINQGSETILQTTRTYGGIIMASAFGIVGFLDDYISIKKKRNLGLTERQKLILQFLIAGSYLFSVYLAGGTSETIIPFIGTVDLGIFYYIIACLGIVGMVNAVNFSDGVDGLCGCVTFVTAIAFMLCASILSYYSISLVSLAVAGACLGFLWWNFNPAKVFMGDTGSLFLGGIVCALAFGINMPILLLPVGIIYIVEIMSVVLQVTYFKATKGKRLFKMSPIHHHYEMSGWSEVKICTVFSIVTAVGSVVAILCVIFG
ncbi:MAG: phospho-N-acetylmuramoyl-pentapeptide-transferase [Clostridia bacterium]